MKWSGPEGGESTPVVRIRCVHYIEQKNCTARFATGAPATQAGVYREGPLYCTVAHNNFVCTLCHSIL